MMSRKINTLGHAAARLMALAVCMVLLTGCAGNAQPKAEPVVGDRTYRQLRDSARSSLSEQGDASLALALYTQALQRAQTILNEFAMAEASFGRAASLARLRRYTEALDALETRGFVPTPVQKRSKLLLMARIYLEQEQAEEATAKLDEAVAITATPTPPATATLIRLTRGQLAAMAGDLDTAKPALVGGASGLPAALRAQHYRLAGMIDRLENNAAEASESYLAQADAARAHANWPAAAEATARAAEALATSGDFARAAGLYFQAGRSATLQKHAKLPAKQWLNAAIQLGQQSNNQSLIRAAQQLLESQRVTE